MRGAWDFQGCPGLQLFKMPCDSDKNCKGTQLTKDKMDGLTACSKNKLVVKRRKDRRGYAPAWRFVAARIELAYFLRASLIDSGSSWYFSIISTITLPAMAASAPAL